MLKLKVVKSILAALILSQLTACGLGGMAAGTATEAAAQAEEAKNAKAMEDRLKRSIEASQQASKQQIDNAEADTAN